MGLGNTSPRIQNVGVLQPIWLMPSETAKMGMSQMPVKWYRPKLQNVKVYITRRHQLLPAYNKLFPCSSDI